MIVRAFALFAVVAGMAATAAWGQSYPARPINLVVPFGSGSGTDQAARALAQAIPAELNGATVIVINKPGADGIIAAEYVAHATPDGYTVFMTTNTTQAANPSLHKKLPYDPVADFAPITALGKGSMVLVVNTASAITSMQEFMATAKSKSLTFGAGNSSSRVAAEMFKQMTGSDLTFVAYKSNPAALTDLLGGQIDLMFADTATAQAQIQGGKLRALAYTGAKRTSAFASLPTIDEAGVKGYESSYWIAVYAPRGTPPDIVRQLNAAFIKGVHTDAVKLQFARAVLDIYTTSPAELAEFQQAEIEKWGRVIKGAGIQPE